MAQQILIYGVIILLQGTALAAKLSSKEKDGINITSVKYQGSGCPKGSVYVDLSPDKEVFTTAFNQFTVTKNGNQDPFGQTKDCRLTLTVRKPENIGFQFFSIDIEGAADLEDELVATQKIAVHSLGKPYKSPKRAIVFEGPYSDSYERTEEFDFIKKPWLACGRKISKLSIKTQVAIKPSRKKKNNKFGFMSVNLSEGVVKEKLDVIWANCDKNKRKKPYFSFCRLKVYNNKKNKVIRTKISRARAEKEKDSLTLAKDRAKEICQKIQNKKNRSCELKKIKCKTQKLF